MIMQNPGNDLRTLISLVEMKADRNADGHLTIMRFTTEWKVMFGTPNLDTGEGRGQVRELIGHETLEEALSYLIICKQEV